MIGFEEFLLHKQSKKWGFNYWGFLRNLGRRGFSGFFEEFRETGSKLMVIFLWGQYGGGEMIPVKGGKTEVMELACLVM